MNGKCKYMNFSTTFNPVAGITQKFINNSQCALGDRFSNPNILPVPDMIQDDVPRIISNSNDGYSKIILSKINCSVSANFDDDWSNDWIKCMQYFENCISTAKEIAATLETDDKLMLKFLGITTKLFYDSNDAVHLLENHIINAQLNNICDIDLQVTQVIQDRYYINIRIANSRLFDNNINPLSCGFLENNYTNGICVTIDINNRYAFSKGLTRDKECNLIEIETIKSLLQETIESLPEIFGKEVFNEKK